MSLTPRPARYECFCPCKSFTLHRNQITNNRNRKPVSPIISQQSHSSRFLILITRICPTTCSCSIVQRTIDISRCVGVTEINDTHLRRIDWGAAARPISQLLCGNRVVAVIWIATTDTIFLTKTSDVRSSVSSVLGPLVAVAGIGICVRWVQPQGWEEG